MSKASEFLDKYQRTPGRSPSVKLGNGEWTQILFDPENAPGESKFSLMVAVHEKCDQGDGNPPLWFPRTFYCTGRDLETMVEKSGESRCVFTVSCEFQYKMDKDGNHLFNRNGEPIYNRAYTFDVYARNEALSNLALPKVLAPVANGNANRPKPTPLG